MIKLRRNGVFLYCTGIIILFYFLNKTWFLINTSTTTGKCTGYHTIQGRRSSTSYPIIEFTVDYKTYQFEGIEYTPYSEIDEDEPITVLYKNSDPAKAYQFNFMGFWYYGILYSGIIILALFVFCYGLLEKRHIISVILPFRNGQKGKIIISKGG